MNNAHLMDTALQPRKGSRGGEKIGGPHGPPQEARGVQGGVETARPVIEQRRRGYVPRATATMPRWWMNRFAAVNAEAARGGTGGRRLTPARRSRGSPPVLRSDING